MAIQPREGADALYGILLDVSGSMRKAYAIDQSHHGSVERTHAIFTTILKIVKREVIHHDRREIIFASAFGLDHEATDVCDLLFLLNILRNPPEDAFQALIELAECHGEGDTIRRWINEIEENLSQVEAQLLYAVLYESPLLFRELCNLIPSSLSKAGFNAYQAAAVGAAKSTSFFLKNITLGLVDVDFTEKAHENVNVKVRHSRAYKRAQDIITETLKQPLAPKPIQDVSDVLDDVFSVHGTRYCSEMLHERIQKFIDVIKPFIFGYTPMCKALNDAMVVFKKERFERRKAVLFILSDGSSSDGNPRPIAKELDSMGVIIATCFLTSDPICNPKKLFSSTDYKFGGNLADHPLQYNDGRNVLFEMSSVEENNQPPISNLVDVNWELSPSGESNLFFQANSLDVVNDFCETVISQMTMSCDALVDLIEKVDLATLINQENAQFKAKEQELETCYANAIAAVFYLALHRIVGRKPDFYEIRERIIDEYGYEGANTEDVLNEVCKEYRLHFVEVDETSARQAINERRPVIARYRWYEEEKELFKKFYKKNPKGILKKDDLRGELYNHRYVYMI